MKVLLAFTLLFCFVAESIAQNEVNIIKVRKTQGDTRIISAGINYSDVILYALADIKPEFPGGKQAFISYLDQNLRYPEPEKSKGVTGTVKVTFIVDPSGFITNAEIFESGTTNFNTEAIRLIYNMPRWTPGQFNGQIVPVQVTLTVNFKMN